MYIKYSKWFNISFTKYGILVFSWQNFFLFPHTYVDKLCGYSIAAFFQSSGAMLGID